MIISRTPFRVSLFGGGTDFPQWYKKHGGVVLSTTIDKYCYITCRKLPPFFDHKFRLLYAKVENTKTLEEIQHPVVREVIKHLGITEGLEIHHDADLPARSGVGSSSAFTVGLLNTLMSLKGISASAMELATTAIHVERDLVKDNGGDQDQIAVAHGGFNRIDFGFKAPLVTRLNLPHADEFQAMLMLFFTRTDRSSSESQTGLKFIESDLKELSYLTNMAEQCLRTRDYRALGELLNQAWEIKKRSNQKVSNNFTDEIYMDAIDAGAWGGKVIGAGAGGFMLFMVPLEAQDSVKQRLSKLLHVPFKFEWNGTKVIFNNE